MSVSAFRYVFTMKELKYLLFSKKTCPNCNSIMNKSKGYEMVDGSIFDSASVPLYIKGRDVKYYHYLFVCPNCKSQYKLKDIVNNQ